MFVINWSSTFLKWSHIFLVLYLHAFLCTWASVYRNTMLYFFILLRQNFEQDIGIAIKVVNKCECALNEILRIAVKDYFSMRFFCLSTLFRLLTHSRWGQNRISRKAPVRLGFDLIPVILEGRLTELFVFEKGQYLKH